MDQHELVSEHQLRHERYAPQRRRVYDVGDVIWYYDLHYMIIDGGYQELTGNQLWIYNTYCLERDCVQEMVFYPPAKKVG